jgi:signal transduction histidine kinase
LSVLSVEVCLGLELLSEDLSDYALKVLDPFTLRLRDSVDELREASGIAVEILNDLLQYDKMQDNTLQLQRENQSPLDIAKEVVGTFKIQVVTI